MKQEMYRKFANYYDPIYSTKNYKKESETVIKLIKKFKKSPGKRLLDVGCGSGKHLTYLRRYFSCKGIDVNEGILKIAKENVRSVEFKKANMISFKLSEQFDVITSLFSAIGYVKTKNNLRKTIKNFYKHLKPGGVVIIEPWISKSEYKSGLPFMATYNGNDMKIARVNVARTKGDISILEFHFLIGEKNKPVMYFVDKHELGLFEVRDTLRIMKDAGFNAKFLKINLSGSRGVYVCTKS